MTRAEFVIHGRLPGLNDYIKANRANRMAGAAMKKKCEKMICSAIVASGIKPFENRINITVYWFEPNERRDPDNIEFAIKFILDSMKKCGIIHDDGRKFVNQITHLVGTDRNNPEIIVVIDDERKKL